MKTQPWLVSGLTKIVLIIDGVERRRHCLPSSHFTTVGRPPVFGASIPLIAVASIHVHSPAIGEIDHANGLGPCHEHRSTT